MIGGTDLILSTTATALHLNLCVRTVRHFWPQARFEDARSGQKYARYADIPFGLVRELFVYRNAETEADWDAPRESPPNGLLYFLLSPESRTLTVVVDDPETEELQQLRQTWAGFLYDAGHFGWNQETRV